MLAMEGFTSAWLWHLYLLGCQWSANGRKGASAGILCTLFGSTSPQAMCFRTSRRHEKYVPFMKYMSMFSSPVMSTAACQTESLQVTLGRPTRLATKGWRCRSGPGVNTQRRRWLSAGRFATLCRNKSCRSSNTLLTGLAPERLMTSSLETLL